MLRNTFSMDADSCQDIHMQISTAMHRRAHAQQQSVARALPWAGVNGFSLLWYAAGKTTKAQGEPATQS